MGNFWSSIFGRKQESPKSEEPTTPERPTPATDDDFAKKLLEAQNEYRMKHGAEPLTLDKDLCDAAQAWADNLKDLGKLQHADSDDGENLAFASPELTAQGAADMWYKEIKDYDFKNPGFTSGTGHFTQLVWIDSKKFGAGVAKGTTGVFVVGRYRPAGNVTNPGYYEKNVLPAK